MKFDFEAFKLVLAMSSFLLIFIIVVSLPACFNTPKPGHLNMGNTLITIAVMILLIVILLKKYL